MSEFPLARLQLSIAVKAIQDRLGITDADIARELGIQASTVRRWKTGRHVPAYGSIRPLRAIARRANVEIDPGSMVR